MNKPQIHPSMLTMYERCGPQFQRRYGARFGWADKEEIIPPGVAFIIGISTDKAVSSNLQNVIDTHELLPLDAVKEIAFNEATGLWQNAVFLHDDETIDIDKTKGESIDMAVTLSALHAVELAPTLSPGSVQEKFVIKLDGYPCDLSGAIDITETAKDMTTGEGRLYIRDTKTASKSPSSGAADLSEQLSMYALAKKVQGVEVNGLFLDFLVKTKTPKVVVQSTTRTEHQLTVLIRRIERMIEGIEKGVFIPARQDDWACSPRFCGYYASCKFGGGR